jgi:hypothetical protein
MMTLQARRRLTGVTANDVADDQHAPGVAAVNQRPPAADL